MEKQLTLISPFGFTIIISHAGVLKTKNHNSPRISPTPSQKRKTVYLYFLRTKYDFSQVDSSCVTMHETYLGIIPEGLAISALRDVFPLRSQ
jgi:hypothetical protein